MTSPRPNPRLLALLVACAMFMAQLDSTIVLTALPQIAQSFRTSAVDLSIGITVYIVAITIFLPASAWVAERFGARRVFAAAIAGFTVASILCGLCQTLPQFIAARALQGLAAALMTPVGRVLMLQSTPKENLVAVMTISTVPMLVAPTIGPPVGGLIVTYFSWPWIFFLNVPIGIATILLVLRYAPSEHTVVKRPFDGVGFVVTGIAVTALLYGLDRLASPSSNRVTPLALIAIGIMFGIAAFRHARRRPHPSISLSPLRIHTFSVTTIGGGALARIPARAIMFILPLMFQVTMGLNAFVSGILLLAVSGGDLLLKLVTTRTLRRFGFRSVLIVCGFFSAVTIGLCALFSAQTPLWSIFTVLFVSGMFRSLLFTGLGTLTYVDIPQQEIGAATVLWNMTQQITNALSVSVAALLFALSSIVLNVHGGHLSLADCRLTLIVMAAIGLIPLISFARLPLDAGAQVSGHRGNKFGGR